MEECIKEELPATTELEEGLRNGVILAKLGHFMAPTVVPLRFHIFVPADIKSTVSLKGEYLTLTSRGGAGVGFTSSTPTILSTS